jgi:DNA polymerase-3 subunit beta
MRFTLPREILLKPLQQVIGAVERRQTLPALGNILVRAGEKGIELTATDLEIELVATVVQGVEDAGETTLPARKLLDIVKALPEGVGVSVKVEAERAVLTSGRSRFTLSTLPAAEFPALEDFEGTLAFKMSQDDLKHLIDRTGFAMAQQDVRYYLNGLLIELGDRVVRAVATDGHRLAICEMSIDQGREESRQVIVPRKGITELGRLLTGGDAAAEVQLGANHIRVTLPEVRFTSKLIDGRFPDYERVMPQGNDKVLTADRLSLREALARTAILSNEKYRGIRLLVDGESLSIQANNPDQEEAQEELSVDYQGSRIEVGFNVNYLLDCLNVLDSEEVRVLLRDANSSCLIQDPVAGDCRYVVMPMRL